MVFKAPKAAITALALTLTALSSDVEAKEPNWQNKARTCAAVRDRVTHRIATGQPDYNSLLASLAGDEGKAAEKACHRMAPKLRRQRYAWLFRNH